MIGMLEYAPHGLIAAVAATLGYVGRRHFKDDRKIAARVSTLEADHVGRPDIERVYDKLDAVKDQISSAQTQILAALVARDHSRS